MEISSLFENAGLGKLNSFKEIAGGEDSSVWKVVSESGGVYALRIIAGERLDQFLYEHKMISTAREWNIPVPAVRYVGIAENKAFMVVDWAKGRTVMEELINHPNGAFDLGFLFGEMQGRIHKVKIQPEGAEEFKNWLTPAGNEESWPAAAVKEAELSLLHLDYHPLNVLTDGSVITAVIDWSNGSAGDKRFDVARTFSILQTEANQIEGLTDLVNKFEEGWRKGYVQVSGEMDHLPEFYRWAGFRMIRDVEGKRPESHINSVLAWARSWG